MRSNEFKPHAFITESNSGGIEIMLNHSCDGIFYRWNYGQDNLDKEEIFEAEIQYDQEGDTYFMHKARAIYLTEAMRIN
jgi:hypothetical protein